jgi:regulatory protein
MLPSTLPINVIKMSDYENRSFGNNSASKPEKKPLELTEVDTPAKNSAFRYLARREYSRLELYQRLITKGYASDMVNHLLDYLQEKDYQSDERYTDMYIRSRANAGDGPFKIKMGLRVKGIFDSLSNVVFDKLAIDWHERAQFIKIKRFGDGAAEDITELSKQFRFLKNRGFYQEHIDTALNYSRPS